MIQGRTAEITIKFNSLFQAVGVIEGEVESTDNKLKVSIGEYSKEYL